MLLLKTHYSEPDAQNRLSNTLGNLFQEIKIEPIFICIGSNRHILDCFGPIIGTMLSENNKNLCVYGTLDEPLHAKNLSKEIKKIKNIHTGAVEIAIDACVSNIEPIGTIQLRQGQLFPGKALFKRLPPVGHLSITGVVDQKLGRGFSRNLSTQSIAPVYHMAVLISNAITKWNQQREIY